MHFLIQFLGSFSALVPGLVASPRSCDIACVFMVAIAGVGPFCLYQNSSTYYVAGLIELMQSYTMDVEDCRTLV